MCKDCTRIYFEDEYCAVVYKKAGEDSQTFFTVLFPHKPFIAAVNRLDTPVSGLLLLAFSTHVQTLLSCAFKDGAIKKEYWAVCERTGTAPAENNGPEKLEHWVGFRNKIKKAFIGAGEKQHSPILKKAVLYWTLCGKGERYDFIRINPETGRTHQIRVQMAAIGRPIKGDLKYGARRSERGGGIRLHAFGLHFTHPITGKRITVEAEPLYQDSLWNACKKACANRINQDGMKSGEAD